MFYKTASDSKFWWLITAAVLVTFFEILALTGIQLPPKWAIPIFAILILGIGYRTLFHGLEALLKLNFKSINLLMMIATCGAFYLGKYEEAAVVIVLYTLAEKLEAIGIIKSRSALDALLKEMPKEATFSDTGKIVPLASVQIGDRLTIKPGGMFPLDGQIIKGNTAVDESTITGEPLPQDKLPGDLVFAGTLNLQGAVEIQVSKIVGQTTLAKIRELTFHAAKTKAPTQQFIESFSQIYTPLVIGLAVGLMIIPAALFGGDFWHWFQESLTLLVIACPCALVISTPIAIYSAIGNASKQGVLIKGGRYLEALGVVKAIAFDKTRTLTLGRPHVSDVVPFGSCSKEDLLSCAAGIEQFSEHPLSQSIVDKANELQYLPHRAANFQAVVGKGVKADCLICQNSHHCIGKLSFILEEHQVPSEVLETVDSLQTQGKTVIVVSTHQEVEGVIALSDTLRQDSHRLIQTLHKMAIKTIMLTGDHASPAKTVAKDLGIDEVYADLLPQDKAALIQKLQDKYKHVAMVGDGLNDAPALALSSVGITMSSLGNDTAIEASNIVILNDNLSLIPKMITLSRRTVSIIRFNLFWAVAVKILFIALALTGYSNLALAIFADVGVTLLVILNSLRLLYRI